MSASKLLLSNIQKYIYSRSPLTGSLRTVLSSSSYSFHGVRACSYVHDEGTRIEIKGQRWPHSLHLPHIWLRDHCRCPKCYNAETSQRLLDITSVSNDIRPCNVKLDDEQLNVVWPDGHTTEFSLQFLWQNSYEGISTSAKNVKQTWNNLSFPDLKKLRVTKDDFLQGDDGVKSLIEIVQKYGLGMVSGVKNDVDSTREVVEAVAPVLKTFYGEMWAFSDNKEHADLAYSTQYLGAHNDTTYFNEGARIQTFHCLKAAEKGGETLLVDGFHIAKQLKERYPQAYEFFSTNPVSGEFIGDGQYHHNIYKVISHHPVTGALQQFRYNLYDRAPVNTMKLGAVEDYYSHLQALSSLVTKKPNEVWISLLPGTVLFVDNWRVMHGRAAYSGARTMAGCYVGNDAYRSRARTLGIVD